MRKKNNVNVKRTICFWRNYTEGMKLDRLVKTIIDKTATYEVLENRHYTNLAEAKLE